MSKKIRSKKVFFLSNLQSKRACILHSERGARKEKLFALHKYTKTTSYTHTEPSGKCSYLIEHHKKQQITY